MTRGRALDRIARRPWWVSSLVLGARRCVTEAARLIEKRPQSWRARLHNQVVLFGISFFLKRTFNVGVLRFFDDYRYSTFLPVTPKLTGRFTQKLCHTLDQNGQFTVRRERGELDRRSCGR